MNIQNDAFAALRYRDFSIVTLNQFCLTLAILIQEIIVAYSLYQITRDPLTLVLLVWLKQSHSLHCLYGAVISLINCINRPS
mgnify:CR=1 FL=1